MTNVSLPPSGPPVPPSVGPTRAVQLLTRQIARGEQILTRPSLSSDDHRAWEAATDDSLTRSFGSESPNRKKVMEVGKGPRATWGGAESDEVARRRRNLTTQIQILKALAEVLQEETEAGEQTQLPLRAPGNDVFLVHGHDETATQETARFLERGGLHVIILREQPNHGRTIIEKFVDYSNVRFAVVLLTPDDKGGTASAPARQLKSRARQNVILELGFFLGKLGRRHVCALYREGVEIPSDYSGVLFVPLDPGGAWKLELARELKAAGLPVDVNSVL